MKGDEEYQGGGAYHAFLKLFNEHFVEEQKKKKRNQVINVSHVVVCLKQINGLPVITDIAMIVFNGNN